MSCIHAYVAAQNHLPTIFIEKVFYKNLSNKWIAPDWLHRNTCTTFSASNNLHRIGSIRSTGDMHPINFIICAAQICKECCIRSPLTLISTCSHLWSSATLFLGGDCLTFNITPPQTTFMNSSFTKCKYSSVLENDLLCGDLHDFCQQDTDCKAPLRHLN